MSSTIETAHDAFARQAWREASAAFGAATADAVLGADDYEQFAIASYLAGDDKGCAEGWEGAYRVALVDGDLAGAARSAILLALCLFLRGQMAQAGGWAARAEGLVDECGPNCVASGYVLIPKLLGALHTDPAAAADLATQAITIAKHFGDADLCALGILGHGQALIAAGDTRAGVARLDEGMLSVAAGEVGPVVAGIVYCAVIIECLKLYDLARASEWTTALSDWCERQPDLVPYRGQCLVHRSQLHLAAGRWADADAAAEAACRHLVDPPHPALGLAYYQAGEVHRLRGELDRAEAAYRAASGCGFDPLPGLALLELARGDATAATASIRRALGEPSSPLDRAPLLAAATEILVSTGDFEGARRTADELTTISEASESEVLRAMASHAVGAVLVADGKPAAGLANLRAAARDWQSLSMPYEAARTATAIAGACAAVGDHSAAAMELDNARTTFRRLGAASEIDRLADAFDDRAGGPDAVVDRGGRAQLSAREAQVLTHLAAGKTNREIADVLLISQHTVGRHVENIFAKLGVSTRAAATAYAYEHGLLTER